MPLLSFDAVTHVQRKYQQPSFAGQYIPQVGVGFSVLTRQAQLGDLTAGELQSEFRQLLKGDKPPKLRENRPPTMAGENPVFYCLLSTNITSSLRGGRSVATRLKY